MGSCISEEQPSNPKPTTIPKARVDDYDHLLKVVLVGDSCVGKSSLLLRYTENTFNDNYISTIGVDFKIKVIELAGQSVKMQLWDTAGQERFVGITQNYYRGAHSVMVVYDLTNSESYQNLRRWIDEIKRHMHLDMPFILIVGNKCDLVIDRKQIPDLNQDYLQQLNIQFIETSAKSSVGVVEAFNKLAEGGIQNRLHHK